MTPGERQLITGLFERMRDFGAPEKDREAETLINQSVRAMPDAPYMLVQSVLVQEQALQAANARVQELEERVQALADGGSTRGQSSGSFLGGLFGGGQPTSTPRSSSVPAIGSRAPAYPGPSAWSQGGPQAQAQPQQAPAASGSFMRSALATAAGVAGGMLLADSIRNMMGSAQASPAADKAAGGSEPQYTDPQHNDPGTHDANDPGHDGGGEFGGDFEI